MVNLQAMYYHYKLGIISEYYYTYYIIHLVPTNRVYF